MRSVHYSALDTCTVTEDILNPFETASTENNKDVQPGYQLNPGEILHVMDCEDW